MGIFSAKKAVHQNGVNSWKSQGSSYASGNAVGGDFISLVKGKGTIKKPAKVLNAGSKAVKRVLSAIKGTEKNRERVPGCSATKEEIEGKKKSCTMLGDVARVVTLIFASSVIFAMILDRQKPYAYLTIIIAAVGIMALVVEMCLSRKALWEKTDVDCNSKFYEKNDLFLVIKFKSKMLGFFDGYALTKKFASENVPTRHLDFNPHGKLLFKGCAVQDGYCVSSVIYGNKMLEDDGQRVALRMHFRDPYSTAFLNEMRLVMGDDPQSYLTLKSLKVKDIKEPYRHSACFKYKFDTRASHVRFSCAMAEYGHHELLLGYLDAFMPKVSYTLGKCELSKKFMETKEWRLLCLDQARYGVLSYMSKVCKGGMIEDQKKFLKCFLKAYERHAFKGSTSFLEGEMNEISTGIPAYSVVDKGPGFPFGNPRYILAMCTVAKKYGACIEDSIRGYKVFSKDLELGFSKAIFLEGTAIDKTFDYSDKFCQREGSGTYLSSVEKEQVCKGKVSQGAAKLR